MLRILFILLFSLNVFAAQIAVVDMKVILEEADSVVDIKGQIKKISKKNQDEIVKKEDELRKEQVKLKEERSLLAPDVFDEKLKKFKDKLSKAQKNFLVKKSTQEKSLNEALKKVNDQMLVIIEEIAKKKKLDAVIPSKNLLYNKDSLDITKEVLKELNKRLPKISVN